MLFCEFRIPRRREAVLLKPEYSSAIEGVKAMHSTGETKTGRVYFCKAVFESCNILHLTGTKAKFPRRFQAFLKTMRSIQSVSGLNEAMAWGPVII